MNTEHIEIALAAIQIYGASHPRPSEVTQEQACELLGRSAPYTKLVPLPGIDDHRLAVGFVECA